MNINLINLTKQDFTTTYDLPTGSTEWVMPVSENTSVSVETLWGSYTYNEVVYGEDIVVGEGVTGDGVLSLHQSADGENTQAHPDASNITVTGATGISGWQTHNFPAGYLHVLFTETTAYDAGSLRIIVTLKTN